MINGKLQEFVANVVVREQITFGDVRRLERDYLPCGITNREELEMLISLDAKVARADRAWAQWLVPAVTDFIASAERCEQPPEDDVGQWVDRLLAASGTNLARTIARQLRRDAARRADPAASGGRRHQQDRQRFVAQPSCQAALPVSHLATVCSEIVLGPSYRAVLQLMHKNIGLAAVPSTI